MIENVVVRFCRAVDVDEAWHVRWRSHREPTSRVPAGDYMVEGPGAPGAEADRVLLTLMLSTEHRSAKHAYLVPRAWLDEAITDARASIV